jgi:phosphoserine phosphatase
MYSTLINIECIDEIADAAGRKEEVAAIAEADMRGEIADYKQSLRERVVLLKGVSVTHLALVPPPRTHRHRYFGVLAPILSAQFGEMD